MRAARSISEKLGIVILWFAAIANGQVRGRGGPTIFANPGPDAPPGITGMVTDADTGQPIKQFRIIPARLPTPGMAERPAIFDPQQAIVCQDGKYDLRAPARISSGSGGFVIRYEADGYVPEVSRMFRITPMGIEQAIWDIKLRAAVNITGTVKLPSGQPASGAQVVLCSYEYPAYLENGKVTSSLRTITSDKDGKFSIAPDRPGFSLLFLHDQGTAIIKDQELPADGVIQLHPWGKVAGVARTAPGKPAANVLIGLKADTLNPMLFSALFETKTDAQGQFQFDRVLAPQRYIIAPLQNSMFGALLPAQVTRGPMIQTTPGNTTVADIGGKGRPIKGRITFPNDMRDGQLTNPNGEAFWTVPLPLNRPPEYGSINWRKQREIDEALMSAPEYRSYLQSRRVYTMSVTADGTFRVEDVEPGNYMAQPTVGRRGGPVRSALINFTVPPDANAPAGQLLDLGDIRAEVSPGRGGR